MPFFFFDILICNNLSKLFSTERGVCMPTVVLWALFIYIEALVRLKDIKNVPFHLDLCRPFAAHWYVLPLSTY